MDVGDSSTGIGGGASGAEDKDGLPGRPDDPENSGFDDEPFVTAGGGSNKDENGDTGSAAAAGKGGGVLGGS